MPNKCTYVPLYTTYCDWFTITNDREKKKKKKYLIQYEYTWVEKKANMNTSICCMKKKGEQEYK